MIDKDIYTQEKVLDVYLKSSGFENHCDNTTYGPGVRDYHYLYFITKGKGIYKCNNTIYNLGENQVFYIPKEQIVEYKCDDKDPWQFYWVGFTGKDSKKILEKSGINQHSVIFNLENMNVFLEYLGKITSITQLSTSSNLKRQGYLQILLSDLMLMTNKDKVIKKNARDIMYCSQIIKYIEENYYKNISIKNISDTIGLNNDYLCSIFTKRFNMSIKQYIIKYRIEKACYLLKNTDLTIKQVSKSVGYNDQLYFSKAFKKITTKSPIHYREVN